MAACERLKREHPDCWVNTHLSETIGEREEMRALYPDSADYLAVYEKYGLVGPKFSGGHGVWLSDDEFRRLSASGGAITFCPCSNLFLGSGLFRLGRATDPARRVRLSFGSDVGGGNRFSMLNVLDNAYKIGMVNNAMLDDPAEAERNSRQASAGGPPLQSSTTLTGGKVANQIVDIESFGAAQRNIKIKDPALSSVISAACHPTPQFLRCALTAASP